MFQRESKYDFLAIGDLALDIFIELENAKLNCKLDQTECELCFRFGDKIPYKKSMEIPAVGNSGNAVTCATRLGLRSILLSRLGDDSGGQKCLNTLKKNGIPTKYIEIEKGKETNSHFVLSYEVDRTILVKHTDFNYTLPKLPKVKWIYLSSLPKNSAPFYKELVDYLDKNPETKLAFSPGTFQIKIGKEALKEIYTRSNAFFSNVEEAQRILEIESRDPLILAQGIRKLGPEIVVLSDGEKGAYLYEKETLWHIPIYPDNSPTLDRTGAGDSFSATFVSALALGKTPLEALLWAPINPMSVLQQVGAQAGLLERKVLEEYLKNAPESYQTKKIN